jgi:hypothetical protein
MIFDIPYMIVSAIIILAILYATNHLPQFENMSKGRKSLITCDPVRGTRHPKPRLAALRRRLRTLEKTMGSFLTGPVGPSIVGRGKCASFIKNFGKAVK